jgi:hypothetical protein
MYFTSVPIFLDAPIRPNLSTSQARHPCQSPARAHGLGQQPRHASITHFHRNNNQTVVFHLFVPNKVNNSLARLTFYLILKLTNTPTAAIHASLSGRKNPISRFYPAINGYRAARRT